MNAFVSALSQMTADIAFRLYGLEDSKCCLTELCMTAWTYIYSSSVVYLSFVTRKWFY